jgi:hypothetical protein
MITVLVLGLVPLLMLPPLRRAERRGLTHAAPATPAAASTPATADRP